MKTDALVTAYAILGLRAAIERGENDLKTMRAQLTALERQHRQHTSTPKPRKRRRRMSKEARARISKMMRQRWAERRAAKK